MAIEIRITGETADQVLADLVKLAGQNTIIEWKGIDAEDTSQPAPQQPSESEPKGRRGRPRKSESGKTEESPVEPAEASSPVPPTEAPVTSAPAAEPVAEPVEDLKALQNECRVMSAELVSKKILDAGSITKMIREAGAEKIGELINEIAWRNGQKDLMTHRVARLQQEQDLDQLGELAHQLPNLLTLRMVSFRDEVRIRYRTWIIMAWSSAILATGMLVGLFVYTRSAVVRPFKNLLYGARRVANCDFAYRIHTSSSDEIAELAHAINLSAQSFLAIQKDLKEQVRQRSEEVIRNEQLASVGFLAAGVAHEINNPLAAIAWSAEALEARLHRILHPIMQESEPLSDTPTESLAGADLDTLRTYLRRIQDEAFRCKGITERLLDFSRLGTIQRKQQTDMNEIVEDVVDMVRHLGPYRSQKIEVEISDTPAIAWASPQEMTQVVLNLVTNALESLDPDSKSGVVRVKVHHRPEQDQVHLVIEDNGCGMDQEVLKHLFEPFFTRRRDGRGTGLGLPITNRIITDHGGRITPRSDGPGFGSRFEITLPSKLTNDSLYDNQNQLAVA
jgi:signal transduction histidine kinase